MIVAYLPTDSMADAGLPKAEIARLSRQAEELTRKMHAITAADLPVTPEKPYGRFSLVLSGQGRATWREAILQEAAQWQAFASRVSLFSETERPYPPVLPAACAASGRREAAALYPRRFMAREYSGVENRRADGNYRLRPRAVRRLCI